MGNIHPNIKPNGLTQRDLVDWLYMAVKSMETLVQKLDDDGGVPLATYEANTLTALCNFAITNSTGAYLSKALVDASGIGVQSSTMPPFVSIAPTGVSNKDLSQVIYQLVDCLETLTEQLDTDVLGASNYEALCYTAKILTLFENHIGTTIGNGTVFTFKPGSVPQPQLVEFMYQWMDAINTLCTKLDAENATVTDTNYKALCYTAIFTMLVENAAGSQLGASR